MAKQGNYEAMVDEIPMPPPATHHVCGDCETEYFEKKCPNCAYRDRLAEASEPRTELKTELWARIPGGTLTYTAPWLAPDWKHPFAEGEFKVSYLDESDRRLTWACLDLPDNQCTWIKVGARFGVYLFKKHVRST